MHKKAKIAILAKFPAWLVSEEVPNPGGHYAVWLISLYERFSLEDLPYEIHWISLHKGLGRTIRTKLNHQYFHFIPRGSIALSQRLYYFQDSWRLKREIRHIQPEIVHVWGTEDCYAWAVRKMKLPRLLSMQGVLTAYVQRAAMHPFQIRQAKLERSSLPYFSLITAESQWGVDRCRELAPKANIKHWEYAANESFFNKERKLSDSPCCLLAGTNTPVKNIPCAISAFSKPELQHIKLYMAGISPEECPMLPPNIIPLGRVSREKISELLSETWCLVHPSLADTCPNIVKEARVMGVPAIVTTECGAKQYIVDGKSGFIIPPSDIDALVRGVLDVTSGREHCIQMGQYGQAECRAALSSETMLNGLFELYRNVLEKC